MSIYNPSIPQPGDDLSDSQPKILANFNRANSSFGVDHYAFADLTANNGKHNQITTPAYIANPPTGLPPVTAVAEPKIYAFQDTAGVGVINYSRGPSNAVPSPITSLQSTSAAIVLLNNGTTNILDFTGLARAFVTLIAADLTDMTITGINKFNISNIFWNGSAFFIPSQITIQTTIPQNLLLVAQASGNILQLKNISGATLSNVYWTLKLNRLS